MNTDKELLKLEIIMARCEDIAEQIHDVEKHLDSLSGVDRMPVLERLVSLKDELLALSVRNTSIANDLARSASDKTAEAVTQANRAMYTVERLHSDYNELALLTMDVEARLQ